MTRALVYHGKEMDPGGLDFSVSDVAEMLERALPVVVRLEPGDGTHYSLLLVPSWGDGVRGTLGRIGIPSGQHCYLFVARIEGDFTPGVWIDLRHPSGNWLDLERLAQNPWSIAIYRWWLDFLAGELGFRGLTPLQESAMDARP